MRELIFNINCNNAISCGICHADCCRVICIPFIRYFYDKFRDYRYCEPEEILELGDIIYPFRMDTTCVFLNQEKNKCQIYHLRPQVCFNYATEFGCLHFNPDGSSLTRHQKRHSNHDTNISVIKEFRQLQKAVNICGIDNFLENSKNTQILKSLAMPILSIKFMQKFYPQLIGEYDVLQDRNEK